MNGISKLRKGSQTVSSPIFNRKSFDEIHATGFEDEPQVSRKQLMIEGLAAKKKSSGDQESQFETNVVREQCCN